MTDCGENIGQNALFLIKELGSRVQRSKVRGPKVDSLI